MWVGVRVRGGGIKPVKSVSLTKLLDQFINVEDIASLACILDVKVGRRVWDDFTERDKIERERKKCPPQEILGFRIIGMRELEWKNF